MNTGRIASHETGTGFTNRKTGKTGADIGMIGLGVMGGCLAYNIAEHGYTVAGHDNNNERVDALTGNAVTGMATGARSINELLAQLKKPRTILLLVPAGEPLAAVIHKLSDRLDAGDLLVDCGNSHFKDTNRHIKELSDLGINFLGVGISGGAHGARYGPSIMPGGSREAYGRVQPVFEAIAAKVGEEPCVAYLGPGSAGHYVKMVHNGIEYAIMELIAEAYDLLRQLTNMSNDVIGSVFEDWNQGPLSSFLVSITSKILNVPDGSSGRYLVDMILDSAGQKGTGKWSSQDAMELQVPVPTIDTAVGMRFMSGYKQEREAAAGIFPPPAHNISTTPGELIKYLGEALHFSMIAAYAQGFSLLRAASEKYGYDLSPADIARIWRGGCIIRADMLNDIHQIFTEQPGTANLMIEKPFARILVDNRDSIIRVLRLAFDNGVACPGIASTLAYFDAYRTGRLPANLIQEQRDYFGSHTYERIDRPGTFHTQWNKPAREVK